MSAVTYITELVPDLLHKHNCVIVPGFGGFVSNITPAYLQEERQTIHPPSKRIAFNESLTDNDGLLMHALAAKKGCSYDEANEMLKSETESIRRHLEHYRNFEFKNAGTFYLNAENNLLFVPYLGHNYLISSFGLPSVKIRPILQEQDLSVSQKRTHNKLHPLPERKKSIHGRRIWPGIPHVAAAMLLLGLLGFVLLEWSKSSTQSVGVSTAQLWSLSDLNMSEPGDNSLVDELYSQANTTETIPNEHNSISDEPIAVEQGTMSQPEIPPVPEISERESSFVNEASTDHNKEAKERPSTRKVFAIVCFKTQSLIEAESMKRRLASRSYDAGILSGEKANWHYVYAERMYTKDAASQMASMIQNTEQLKTEIIEHIP